MTGFYTTTPKGDALHIRGDIKMDDRALHVIAHAFDLAAEQVEREICYQAALLLVDRIEPAACRGLARAYYNKAGVLLVTLNEVERAIIDGELAV